MSDYKNNILFKEIISLIYRLRPDLYENIPKNKKINFDFLIFILNIINNEEKFKSQLYYNYFRYINTPTKKAKSLPFKVKLILYSNKDNKNIHEIEKAFKLTGIQFFTWNYTSQKKFSTNNHRMNLSTLVYSKFSFNIFFMSITQINTFLLNRKYFKQKNQYNIFYNFSELNYSKNEWSSIYNCIDEIWVTNQFIYRVLAPISPRPVLIMPIPIDSKKIRLKKRKNYEFINMSYLNFTISDIIKNYKLRLNIIYNFVKNHQI